MGTDQVDAACGFTTVTSAEDEVRMARFLGGEWLLVNGEMFIGDPDRRGFRGVPVALRKGENRIFVLCTSGTVELELWKPATRMVIGTWDLTWSEPGLADSILFPIFNASILEAENVHVHYGHAVGCLSSPRVTQWRDGGFVLRLGLQLVSTSYRFLDRDPATYAESVQAPVIVYEGSDTVFDRVLMQRAS